jgi:alkaline phosphatase
MFQQAPEGEGAAYDPVVSLPEMTQKAIDILSQDPDGFFLMVEEEGIDEMAHQSNAGLVIKSGRQLDEAVKVGQSYAQSDPETLVIVTADHETGSLAIEDTNEIQNDPAYPNESGAGQTKEDVPLTAMGPGSENLIGVYENTHIHDAMVEALFGSSSASATASASASATASAQVKHMPGTGGPALSAPLLALTALLAGVASLAIARVVVSKQ